MNTYYMVGLQRNKDPELTEKERNTSYLIILDDRKHGRTAKIPLFYDRDTGDYLEPPEGFLESSFQTLTEWYGFKDKTPKIPEKREEKVTKSKSKGGGFEDDLPPF